VGVLLERGAAKSRPNGVGLTPLHLAARAGHALVVAALAEAGADLHARDFQGWRPLHHSAYTGKVETCELLLRLGADPTLLGYRGRLARNLAQTRGYPAVVACLEAAEGKGSGKARLAFISQMASEHEREHINVEDVDSFCEER